MSPPKPRDSIAEGERARELLERRRLVEAVRAAPPMSLLMSRSLTLGLGGCVAGVLMLAGSWADASPWLLALPLGVALAWAYMAEGWANEARQRLATVTEILDRSGVLEAFETAVGEERGDSRPHPAGRS